MAGDVAGIWSDSGRLRSSSTGSLTSPLSSPPPTSKSSGRTLCLATGPCMGRVRRWPDQPPLKEVCELLDSEPRVSYDRLQRPLGQFGVSWYSHSAMRFFLLPHDDAGTGLVVGFEPRLGQSLDALDSRDERELRRRLRPVLPRRGEGRARRASSGWRCTFLRSLSDGKPWNPQQYVYYSITL